MRRASVVLAVGGMLALAGCSAAGEPTGASPSVAAAPSPSVAPGVGPPETPGAGSSTAASEEPSLTPEEQAARGAEAAYVAWYAFRDATLQDPPPIGGEGAEAEAAFDAFLSEVHQYGFEEVEANLVSLVDQYLERGWRQVGGVRVTELRTVSMDLDPAEGRSAASVRACVVPDGNRLVDADGNTPPEFEGVEAGNRLVDAEVELVQEGSFDGWYVRSLKGVEGEAC